MRIRIRNSKVLFGLAGFLASMTLAATTLHADAAAAALYKAKCAACHGPDGKGQTPAGKNTGARDFSSDEVRKESDDDLAGIIASGKGKMPSYKKSLQPDQIKGLVAYVRSLAKK